MLKLYHNFSHPVFRAACWLISEDAKGRRVLKEGKKEEGEDPFKLLCGRVVDKETGKRSGLGAARWQLAALLAANPKLMKFRSHYLKEARARAKAEENKGNTNGAAEEEALMQVVE